MTSLLERYSVDDLRALIEDATPAQAAVILAGLEDERDGWNPRPKQVPPEGDWLIWLLVTGRRWGKTRTAAEWLRRRALATLGTYAICAPTYAAVRDICVEGGFARRPSGFLSVCRPGEVKTYNRSLGEIVMANGSKIHMLSTDDADTGRGHGFVAVWCDEFAMWKRPEIWTDVLLPATTMADRHRFVITTTPKRNDLTRMILGEAERDPVRVRLVRGHTLENEENLAEGVVAQLREQMSERTARQELGGELLDDVDGALWDRALLERTRREGFPDLAWLVIGMDPAVTSGEDADETGIVVVGRSGREEDGEAWVLEDGSDRFTPTQAMARVVDLYHEHEADEVIIEANNGGDYLPALLATIDPSVKIRTVHATRGKLTRAEPVHGLYAHDRVHHVNAFPALEDSLTSWVPGDPSPDRMDALVWACKALFPHLGESHRRLRYAA